MSLITPEYPGETADPDELVRLADEFRSAATMLLTLARKGEPLSRSPARVCAIQAIELYLSAYLMLHGIPPKQIRALQHDLARRHEIAAERGLNLRRRTATNLDQMTLEREYLVSRYGPEKAKRCSDPNRLAATLNEVAEKVRRAIVVPASS